jgi:superfamily I DNA and/or RNA helicase
MIGFLPPEALGWLLVDEAGQASPQEAVGALMRARRAIVVGDPLQVEPVTTLPTQLAETVCDEFKVNPDRWNAPVASVQTVADAASSIGAMFPREGDNIRVGVPLLVHRRCAEPMFSLSKRIAYAELMVKATPPRTSAIREVLGASHWIDVRPGRTEDKWSELEGEVVMQLIRRLETAGISELDLYIITPFRIVAQRLRDRLGASGLLKRWTDDPWEWTRNRVGTVHTVQGREADSIIFVLGAPLPAQSGARAWAGGSVNLLNVAATRAQENLYVIGSRSAWEEAGVFGHLADYVPQRT